jgi:hypothetical protein
MALQRAAVSPPPIWPAGGPYERVSCQRRSKSPDRGWSIAPVSLWQADFRTRYAREAGDDRGRERKHWTDPHLQRTYSYQPVNGDDGVVNQQSPAYDILQGFWLYVHVCVLSMLPMQRRSGALCPVAGSRKTKCLCVRCNQQVPSDCCFCLETGWRDRIVCSHDLPNRGSAAMAGSLVAAGKRRQRLAAKCTYIGEDHFRWVRRCSRERPHTLLSTGYYRSLSSKGRKTLTRS